MLASGMPPNESILEILTRGAAAGAFFGMAIALARGSRTPARVTGALFCLGALGHTLTQIPLLNASLGLAGAPVWAFSLMGAGLFWAFALELFGDNRALTWVRFAPAFALLVIGVAAALVGEGLRTGLLLAHNVVGAGLMLHVLLVVWRGWRNDLVESRRRLRGPVLTAGALYAVAVIVVQISEVLWRPASVLSPLAAGALLILGLAGVGALLTPDPDLFGVAGPAAVRAPDPLPVEMTELAARLERLMREDRVYRQEGLSVAGLALKLGIPEYRLRRLINQQLGHRNFNAYLGQWRLGDAKQSLSDPAERDVPITTIALDAGYQSLGPFNRAFKAETGLTPTEYRERALRGGR